MEIGSANGAGGESHDRIVRLLNFRIGDGLEADVADSTEYYGFHEDSFLICRSLSDFAIARSRLGKKFEHLAIKCRDVVRLAAAHPITIDQHFSILPFGSGVAEIVLNGVIAGDLSSSHKSGRHQQPRPVADHRNRLACAVDGLRKLLRFRYYSQSIGIECSVWQEQSVKLRRIDLVETFFCFVLLGFVVMLEGLNLAALRRDHCDLSSRFFQCFFRFYELWFFYSVGKQYGNT